MTAMDVTSVPRVQRIRPGRGLAWPDLRELWQHRDLVVTLAKRDLKVRYKQTVLGVTWVVLQPLLAAGILTFVFSVVAQLEQPGETPAFILTFAGTVGFDLFRRTLERSNGSLVNNAGLVSKIYFPRLVLPLAAAASTIVDFFIALGMMAVMLAIAGIWPGASLLLLPLGAVILVVLALGLGILGSSLAVRYRDVIYVLPVITQMVFYASPIAYAATTVPEEYAGLPARDLYYLNPLASLVEMVKTALTAEGHVAWGYVGYAAAVAAAGICIGVLCFGKLEKEFADVV